MSLIRVENLGKAYRAYSSEWQRFAHWFGIPVEPLEEHWVLRNISFSIAAGEAIGIIGQNGAGKSTLLKLITGTQHSTQGKVYINGRIAAILELGMGFNPEFSGRQNAHHGLSLMGFSQREIERVMPELETFAEIDEYFDHPVRTYSSGMQVRVAFAVATAFRPEILIIDEALSVGDAYFQHKSAARILSFKKQGTTLLFVSHDPGAVKTLCDRAILLEEGVLIKDGEPDRILDYYNAMIAKKEKDDEIRQVESEHGKVVTRSGNKKAKIISVMMLNKEGKPTKTFQVGEKAIIRCKIHYHEPIKDATIGILIRDRLGNDIFGTNTYHLNCEIPEKMGEQWADFNVTLELGYGSYSITVASHTRDSHIGDNHDWWTQALVFQMVPNQMHLFVGVTSLPIAVKTYQPNNL